MTSPETKPPTPEEQVAFLRHLQRLLDEGSFVATYKYALLHALADLCVTHGDDSGAPLELRTRDIAARFVELYWRQAVPYPAGERSALLAQNTGRQAAIVNRVAEARASYGGSLVRLQNRRGEWRELVGSVDAVVKKMPLWKLQTVGTEQVDFLYENVGRGSTVTLRPGVAWCFRAFHPMITDMVEGAWSHYVRRYNPDLFNASTDLRAFLFGSERAPLERYRPLLEDLQAGSCFYCSGRLRAGAIAVDHFIPWRRYPTDLGHNFVLAHAGCNGQKADRLVAERPLLERWVERNGVHGGELVARFESVGVPHDLGASVQVARWAYGAVERVNGQVWVGGKVLEHLSGAWAGILAA